MFVIICRCLWSFVDVYKGFWSFEDVYGGLWSFVDVHVMALLESNGPFWRIVAPGSWWKLPKYLDQMSSNTLIKCHQILRSNVIKCSWWKLNTWIKCHGPRKIWRSRGSLPVPTLSLPEVSRRCNRRCSRILMWSCLLNQLTFVSFDCWVLHIEC